MELKDLTIVMKDNLKVTNIRWKSRSLEISTDGGKHFRVPSYYETINLYSVDLNSGEGGGGGTVTPPDIDNLKRQIREEIINDNNFKAEIAKLVNIPNVNTDKIETNVKNAIKSDDAFILAIANKVVYDDTEIKNQLNNKVDSTTLSNTLKKYAKSEDVLTTVANEIAKVVAGADEDFNTLKEIADWIKNDNTGAAKLQSDISELKSTTQSLNSELMKTVKTSELDGIKGSIKNTIKEDTAFKQELAGMVDVPEVDTNPIKTEVETAIKADNTFKQELSKLVNVDTNPIKDNVKKELKEDTAFKQELAGLVNVDTNTIKTEVETAIKADNTFKQELAGLVNVDTNTIKNNVKKELKEDTAFKEDISTSIFSNPKFKQEVIKIIAEQQTP